MLNFDATIDARHGFPISIVDPAGSRLLVSEQFAEFLQRPMDHLVGAPWDLIAHPDDIGFSRLAVARMFEHGRSRTVRRRLIRADGTAVEVLLFGVRLAHSRTKQFVVQGNMCPVPSLEADIGTAIDPPAPANADGVIDYIREIAAELSQLAGRHELKLLEHLLQMASTEAADELKRRWQGGLRQPASLIRGLH